MKSAWHSIRAFVVVAVILGFGGVLGFLALQGNGEAIGAIIGALSTIITYYFASPTGAGGAPHGPTT